MLNFLITLRKYFWFIFKLIKSQLGLLNAPFKLTFVLTKSCNSRCVTCNIWKENINGEMNLEQIKKLAPSFKDVSWVDFTGGEVTLRRDFVDIVKTFHQACPHLLYIHFATNGLKPHKVRDICDDINRLSGVKVVVTVSIDGPPKVNDQIRGVKGNFEKSCDTFNLLNKMSNVDVYIGMTLSKLNCHLILETQKAIQHYCPHFFSKHFHFNLAQTSSHYYGNSLSDIEIQNIHELEQLLNLRRSRGFNFNPVNFVDRIYFKYLADFVVKKKTPVACKSMVSSIYLSEKGELYPCTIWNKPLGKLSELNFDLNQLKKSPLYIDTRNKIKSGNCPNCWTPCEAFPTLISQWQSIVKGLP